MILKRKILTIFCCALLAVFVYGFAGSAAAEEQRQDPWHKVGKEVGETVEAARDATRETVDKTKEVAEKTKEKGVETWQKAKEEGQKALESGKEESKGLWQQVKTKVKEIYEEARAGIHKATESSESKDPVKPPAPSPAK
jgi:hypothetical protein